MESLKAVFCALKSVVQSVKAELGLEPGPHILPHLPHALLLSACLRQEALDGPYQGPKNVSPSFLLK